MINWICKTFYQLGHDEMYALFRLRSEIFVLEQQCVYLDLDGKDQKAHHLMGWDGEHLAACCRIIPPGITYAEPSIGRVCSSPAHRGTGAGKALMQNAIDTCKLIHGNTSIRISAQLYLLRFYSSLGFKQVSEVYLEDDIEHVDMLLR
jgi:ElaA protein